MTTTRATFRQALSLLAVFQVLGCGAEPLTEQGGASSAGAESVATVDAPVEQDFAAVLVGARFAGTPINQACGDNPNEVEGACIPGHIEFREDTCFVLERHSDTGFSGAFTIEDEIIVILGRPSFRIEDDGETLVDIEYGIRYTRVRPTE